MAFGSVLCIFTWPPQRCTGGAITQREHAASAGRRQQYAVVSGGTEAERPPPRHYLQRQWNITLYPAPERLGASGVVGKYDST